MKKLLEMTTHDVAAAAPRLCFWPVGTIEAHDLGPLGTDVIAPQRLAEALCEEFDALLLPSRELLYPGFRINLQAVSTG